MARYFFHLKAGGEIKPDDTGIDLPDEDAARIQAIKGAQSMLAEAKQVGGPNRLDWKFVVADENGRTVMTVPFADAFRSPTRH
jgi:hypothetical protein